MTNDMALVIDKNATILDVLFEYASRVPLNNKTYLYLPYWFCFEDGKLTIHSMNGELPKELIDQIENKRSVRTITEKELRELIEKIINDTKL